MIEVDAILHESYPELGKEQVTLDIAKVAKVELDDLSAMTRRIRLSLPCGRIPELAKLDSIDRIEEVRQRKPCNDVSRQIIGADAFYNPRGLDGEGEIVSVADTGFDQGLREDLPAEGNTPELKVSPFTDYLCPTWSFEQS